MPDVPTSKGDRDPVDSVLIGGLGTTSVPVLAAEPVIDVLVAVRKAARDVHLHAQP